MLFSADNLKFMRLALREAERAFESGEVPVGAVVVHNNQVIGKGYNQVEILKDPTAHAEMIAITASANHIGDWRLNECDIYVTVEPCIMCTGAILNARLRNLYYAEFDPKFGACGSLYNLPQEKKYNHTVNIYSGLCADESRMLLQEFFRNRRIIEKENPQSIS
ncbi:MAG: nucleoside deaminase [Ignavibacteriales bacterium]|nr:MAG: nucleoside deaminase [Ignavibacteriales bacterium]